MREKDGKRSRERKYTKEQKDQVEFGNLLQRISTEPKQRDLACKFRRMTESVRELPCRRAIPARFPVAGEDNFLSLRVFFFFFFFFFERERGRKVPLGVVDMGRFLLWQRIYYEVPYYNQLCPHHHIRTRVVWLAMAPHFQVVCVWWAHRTILTVHIFPSFNYTEQEIIDDVAFCYWLSKLTHLLLVVQEIEIRCISYVGLR